MSRFEDKIVQRKRAERKRRQEALFQKIAEYKMAAFTYAEQFELNQFFAKTDPSDQELMRATALVKERIDQSDAIWKEIMGFDPDKKS